MVVDTLSAKALTPILRDDIAKEARVMTDGAGYYNELADIFAEHGIVAHSKGEYARGDIHTIRIEGFFSIFKRGIRGIYQLRQTPPAPLHGRVRFQVQQPEGAWHRR